ncbi:sporulation membrane protein YtaF [Lederbergia citrea]|uniref:Sporulation membrane protein YtaF n=1 Tax=Lederbergia citrea TaxID=2833581 RepID=A0A942UJQ1_9BACI|nr:sporulation membrane protein YtaF [Lederbergia citrea]MBS4176072.1 sporulation membrane protein YtaF [Lederbergia citrea]MBS4202633.1 sporulation membrane protein YtaF [Lederbergia citrea]MBS4222700.1 sporulation membrane protein YtaF [Lederbergia citrea]
MGFSLSILLLAIAISLDNFSTGLAYGLRKMTIPIKSILIIALCTAVSLGIAMFAGQLLLNVLTPASASRIGGIILILIGAWVIYQFFRTEKEKPLTHEKLVLNWEIKSLGIVVHILKKPTRADIDCSGTITGIEALLLGIALSLDAFGAGIGAAMLGYSPLILAGSAAFMSCIFLGGGLQLGKVFSHSSWLQKFSFMPGVLLVLIGLLKM